VRDVQQVVAGDVVDEVLTVGGQVRARALGCGCAEVVVLPASSGPVRDVQVGVGPDVVDEVGAVGAELGAWAGSGGEADAEVVVLPAGSGPVRDVQQVVAASFGSRGSSRLNSRSSPSLPEPQLA